MSPSIVTRKESKLERSTINDIISRAEAFIHERGSYLPPFAHWSPRQWTETELDISQIVARRLGWDITDFGLDNFEAYGLTLFTMRNGDPAHAARGEAVIYAEKILVVEVDQVTPLHYHWLKTEDIINRGGGRLAIRLVYATEDDRFADDDVTVLVDSIPRRVPAGDVITLEPGQSVTLTPRLFHAFWAEGDRVLVGEVSSVNDDLSDNHFYDAPGRFPTIEEDVPPYRLLVGDYDRIL